MMRQILSFLKAGGLALLLWGAPAAAQEKLIESMIPEAIAQAMRAEGYTADVKRNESGTPYIAAKKEDWAFTIQFFACDLVKGCEGMEFYSWFKRNSGDTLDRINKWNATKRFLRVAIDEDGDLETTMDVSLVGKMTHANFADILDWWLVMSGEIAGFFPEDGKGTTAEAEKK